MNHNRKCEYEMVQGTMCSQPKIIVRVKKDPFDTGRLMRLKWCRSHAPDEWLDRLNLERFGGRTRTSGAGPGKAKPHTTNPHKAMRQLVEGHIVEFLKPYVEALTAEKEVVVGHGRSARVERVPDHRARMQAAEQLFDRVYGKPKQTTQLEGGITVEPVEVPTDNERELEVAKILAAAGAIKDGPTKKIKNTQGAAAIADARSRQN